MEIPAAIFVASSWIVVVNLETKNDKHNNQNNNKKLVLTIKKISDFIFCSQFFYGGFSGKFREQSTHRPTA
jgi:hypothetical protein